jgi:hypothetical protein
VTHLLCLALGFTGGWWLRGMGWNGMLIAEAHRIAAGWWQESRQPPSPVADKGSDEEA